MHTRFVEIAKENELLKAENEKLIKEVARLKADIAHIYKGLH
jgi:cell division protein FtsB